jgi:hypothetical protein
MTSRVCVPTDPVEPAIETEMRPSGRVGPNARAAAMPAAVPLIASLADDVAGMDGDVAVTIPTALHGRYD